MDKVFTDTKDLDWQQVSDAWKGKTGPGEPGVRFKRFPTGSPVMPVGMVVEYEPGHYEGEHSHPVDEFFFMLEGGMQVAGQQVAPGTLVFIAARSSYSIATGPQGALFLRLENAS
jgi:quercetin dioxygenase-like cupin family protein